MKSNSKEVRAAVRKYINDRLDLSEYDMENTAANLFKVFESEYGAPYYRKLYPNTQVRFSQYLRGLPSGLQVEMCQSEVVRILIEDFKTNTPAKIDEGKSFQYFLYLIYAELRRMEAEPRKESEKMLNKIAKTFK
jgi:hypothetical protein